MRKGLPFLLLCILALAGCDSPQRTVETLRKDIAEYQVTPDDSRAAAIEKSFARLDEQIAEVDRKGETIKAAELQRQAANLRGDFQAAQMSRAMRDAKKAIEGFGEVLKNTGKNLQDVFKGTNSEDRE